MNSKWLRHNVRQRIPAQRHYKIKNDLHATLIASISISLLSFRNVRCGASTGHAQNIKHDISTIRGSKVSGEGRVGGTQKAGEVGSYGSGGSKLRLCGGKTMASGNHLAIHAKG